MLELATYIIETKTGEFDPNNKHAAQLRTGEVVEEDVGVGSAGKLPTTRLLGEASRAVFPIVAASSSLRASPAG
jgi:hypothetical protein